MGSWTWSNQKDERNNNYNGPILPIQIITQKRFLSTNSDSSKNHPQLSENSMDINVDKDKVTNEERRSELTQKGMEHAKEGMSKFKILMSKYGYFFVGTYFSVYVGTVYTLFLLLENGLIDASSLSFPSWFPSSSSSHSDEETTLVSMVVDFCNNFEVTQKMIVAIKKRPEFVNLGVAWFATKFTEPFRLGASIYLTPKIAKFFGRKE